MGRHKYRVRLSRDSRLTLPKRDTPVKPALSRRNKYRRQLPMYYEAIPEEPVVEEMTVPTVNPTPTALTYPFHTQTCFTPVHCKSVLCLSSPAFTENPRDKAVSPATPANRKSGYRVSPAGHPIIQMTPEPDAIKGGEMPVKEQHLMTVESITSYSMESDTTFSSDDDDDDDDDDEEEEEEEDCHSASTTSSSLPSPEIFRRESYVEHLTSLPINEELLGLHLHRKNSTLLDVSHAESIHTYHPPDLSNIIDTSMILAEKNCAINQNRGPEAVTKIHTDSEKAFKLKTPPKLTNRRPLLYKKKVWFKSPIVAETFKAKHTPGTKLTGPAEQIQPDTDTFRAGEINSKQEASQLTVKLKRPVQSSLDKAKIFDFIDNSHRDAFFKRMRERCVKLKSAPLFPLTAPKDTQPSIL
ncbi:uncharacterized protein LOC116056114 isoform X2 [Sander lucioperca]|uniref:uncharacterized protein LOC116056114 isoform X2 n=1 Tax=Sander lucioperca TaxID=283035 RepID=UPI001653A478|nr:uncharacterized protein LOC116056114 isoform X2 [Sander lucioperca]